MGVVTGKSGKTYWLDLDNLGGYQNGPNKLDNVIQVTQNENSVYAGAGVYPLEGGYIYINVIQYKTHVFQFSCNNGVASFNHVADSPEANAFILGVGHGTVTSLNDQPGSGLLWTSDVEGSNLRIYNAVPNQGVLTEINSFVTPGTTKFTRPVFGDGIVYQGTTLGYIYAYGAPVNLPLNCTSSNFGTVNVYATSPRMTIQCLASTALTVTAVSLSGNPNFVLSGLPTFPVQVVQGNNFSFQAAFAPATVGPLASSVILNTTQQTPGFSINTPIQLRGTGQSQVALLSVSPVTVAWNGVITGQQAGGVNQTVILQNLGNTILSSISYQFSVVSETGPWLNLSSISSNGSSLAISSFTFFGLPMSIGPNNAVTVSINFNPPTSGNYAVYVQVNSDGGQKVFDVVATGSDYPVAVLEFQKPDGSGWVKYDNTTAFIFGNVTENTSRYLKMRLTNNGSVNAAALSVTVSKPPFGVAGIIGANNQVDLAEGTLVYAGQNVTATLYCNVPKSQRDMDSYNGTAQWTINLNDPTFGKQYVQFYCNAVSEQDQPLNLVTQQAIYRYAGCFTEYNPGRQLQTNIYSGPSNTIEGCISLCSQAGYIFAGTQYTQECWCGYNRPKTVNPDANCNFACTGNVNEICGGNGIDGTRSFISLFGDITRWNGDATDPPGPYVNPGSSGFLSLGCYTEGSQGRALSIQATANNTVNSCLRACQDYLYSGVEYGGECYCGNTLSIGSANASASDCSMTCNNNQTEYCGGPSRLNMYIYSTNGTLPNIINPTTPAANGGNGNGDGTHSPLLIPASIGPFSYVSCYTEGTNGRALTGLTLADNSITLQTCANNCTTFKYFGAEYGRECYCGQSLASGSIPATDGRCNMACSANATEVCGGPNGLTLYAQSSNFTLMSTTTPSASAPTPTIVPRIGVFNYLSCYSEVPGRALTGKAVASNDMTVQYCGGNCTGFSYMAVEYGRECYCGNFVVTGSASVTDGRCSMICAGDGTSICGGPNGLTLYQAILFSNLTSSSTLTTGSSTITVLSSLISTSLSSPTSLANPTLPLPTNTTTTGLIRFITSTLSTPNLSTASPFLNTTSSLLSQLSNTISPASTAPYSSTSLLSNTALPSSSASSSSSSPPSTSLTTASPTNPSTNPSPSSTASPWTYLGCATDSSPRLLTGASSANSTMTVPSCQTFCLSQNLPLAGLEYSRECYCGAALPANTSLTQQGCTMPCAGNASQTCGGSSRLSLYNNTHFTPPRTQPNIGPYTYLGCYTDAAPRVLGAYAFASLNMTEETCVAACQARGFKFAGVEYATQCFCDNSLSGQASLRGDGECSMLCGGDPSEYCGGRSRLNVFVSS